MKLYVAGVSVAAAFAAGGCATEEAFQPTPIGSTWTYAQHNTGSFAAQVGAGDVHLQNKLVKRVWEGKEVNAYMSSQGSLFTTENGDWLAIVGPDDKVFVRYDPPLNWPFPLVVGKTTFGTNFTYVDAAGKSATGKVSCSVNAYEDVKVPAGTFKAYKVVCTYPSGSTDIDWLSPKLSLFVKQSINRTAGNAFGVGTQEIELVSQSFWK